MYVRQITLLAGLAFTIVGCAGRQTETDTGDVEPAATTDQTGGQTTDQTGGQTETGGQTGGENQVEGPVGPGDKGNETKMGVTDTETGESTLGEDVTETNPTGVDTMQTGGDTSAVSDSAAANQTEAGVVDTETGQATTGEDISEIDATDESEGGTQGGAAGQDTTQAGAAGQDTTTQTTQKPPK